MNDEVVMLVPAVLAMACGRRICAYDRTTGRVSPRVLALIRRGRRCLQQGPPNGGEHRSSPSAPAPEPQRSNFGPLYPAAWSAAVLIAIGVIAIIAAVVVPVLSRWLLHR